MEPGTLQGKWYSQQGALLHTLPHPPYCEHNGSQRVLAVQVEGAEEEGTQMGGVQHVALSCAWCYCIWLGSPDTGLWSWSVVWQGEEGRPEPRPATMSRGKHGKIIAWNREGDEMGVSVFSITQKQFNVETPLLKLGIWARHLCYCELPEVGGALAVTDYYTNHKLCMYSLDSGDLLWAVGGKDKKGDWVLVAGLEWEPQGVCTDNRGRLYVADYREGNNRILVFSAESGSILQEITHDELGRPEHISWHEDMKSIIVYNYGYKKITHFQIKF